MKRRVLFVCTANSARSLMAEAVLREVAGEHFDVASAGTDPESPHPLALQVLSDAGIPVAGLRSKSLEEVAGEHWDYVIMLCDKAARECAGFHPRAQHIAWDFADPVPKNRRAAFAHTLRELRERIGLFVLVHQKQVGQGDISYDPVTVFRALGDENRLAMVLLIRAREELCVCEITRALDLPQPKASRHLAVLRDAGLLEGERRGQWIHYRLHLQLPQWIVRIVEETAVANEQMIRAALERLTDTGAEA